MQILALIWRQPKIDRIINQDAACIFEGKNRSWFYRLDDIIDVFEVIAFIFLKLSLVELLKRHINKLI